MGSFANSLFKFMLGWLQGAVSAVWYAFTNEKGNSLFNWIGRNWILIAGVLCAIGLAADLCVYFFRWKPFEVWKSFFLRNKQTAEPEDGEQGPVIPDKNRKQADRSGTDTAQEPVMMKNAEPAPEPDFSQWEEAAAEQERPEIQRAEKPAMVTNAGYIVPEDSPYRRPAAQTTPGPDTEKRENRIAGNDRSETNPVAPRRRRRINVTELLTDPEEELRQYDAPQNVIDSRKAYRDPVYPRGWQKSEDKEE